MGREMLEGIARRGCRPWLPNARAIDLDVWHADDVPTLGTFECDGTTVLFTAVGDVSSETTVWAYLPMDGERRAVALAAVFDSVSEMQAFAEEQFLNSHSLFALATDYSLHHWGTEPVGTGPGAFLKAVTAFLEQVTAVLRDELAAVDGRRARPGSATASRAARRVIREQKQEVSELVESYPRLVRDADEPLATA